MVVSLFASVTVADTKGDKWRAMVSVCGSLFSSTNEAVLLPDTA